MTLALRARRTLAALAFSAALLSGVTGAPARAAADDPPPTAPGTPTPTATPATPGTAATQPPPLPTPDPAEPAPPPPRPKYDGFEELLYTEAAEAMANGDFVRAWHFYWRLLRLEPNDPTALRESGRAAHALGQFDYAEQALGRAGKLRPEVADPELHFLRGESLRALGRKAEADAEFVAAERSIGKDPTERRLVIWLGRILAVQGKFEQARALYEKQLTRDASRTEHTEILMYMVEAYILADDWGGAERILREYLSYWPDYERGREMLAWVLEARGDIEAELTVRRTLLSAPDTRRERVLAYARSLERANDYPAALAHYREVEALGVADVSADIDRIEHRLAPEVGAAVSIRNDPSGSMLGGQAGGSLSFGSRRRLAITGSHEVAAAASLPGVPEMEDVSVSTLTARAIYTRITGGVFSLGATVFTGSNEDLRLGGVGGLRVRPLKSLQLHLSGEANQPWKESASTMRQDGVVDSVTAEVYYSLLSERLVVGLSGRFRRLGLSDVDVLPDRALQLFGAAGLDYIIYARPTDPARGEILDHDLLWPVGMAPAIVASFRHYELDGEDPFGPRLVLVQRSQLDELSGIVRQVLGNGAFGAEARGGIGYDWIREVRLWRAGASLLVSATSNSRLTFDFDIASESGTGLEGRRYAGVMGLHVDI